MPDSPNNSHINESRVISPAVLSAAKPMRWSIQRELWENRSIYLAPLAIATLFLFGFAISTFRLPGKIRSSELDPTRLHETIIQPYHLASLLIMGTTFIVAFFYCLDALYGERRDRSILFWKSLPVSDLTTVLSKMAIPVIVLPLLTVAVTIATHWLMLLFSYIVILASGMKLAFLWTHLPLFQMWTMLLFHLLVVHGPLLCAVLRVDAAGFWLGASRSIFVGSSTAARHRLCREDRVQHVLLWKNHRVTLHWQRRLSSLSSR
jgi:ABC-2 type transport system permease protein